MNKQREQGMILVNVLLFVAVASGVVMLMIAGEDMALHRAIRLRDAGQAQAVAEGGELSAILALRRDAMQAAGSDHAGEAWASLAERGAAIRGGSFDLAIADAQDRFNINSLRGGDVRASEMLGRIAAKLGLPAEVTIRATELVRLYGPISDLRPLRQAGLSPELETSLARLVTALPRETRINVNSASEPLLAILLDNPDMARELVALRKQQGYLLPADFAGRVPLPADLAGFTSDYYWVRVRAQIGESRQQLTSLIARRRDAAGGADGAGGQVRVAAIGRWHGNRAPLQAPRLD